MPQTNGRPLIYVFSIPLLLAVSVAALLMFSSTRQADSGFLGTTITVNSLADTETPDDILTLREAILLATGGQGFGVDDLTGAECAQVSTTVFENSECKKMLPGNGPGLAKPDRILFDIDGENEEPLVLTGPLPVLRYSDLIDGDGTEFVIDGAGFDCFTIEDGYNTIKRLRITNCANAITVTGGERNTIGSLGEGNVIYENAGAAVLVHAEATGTTIRANSVHSNAGPAIDLAEGANAGVQPPVITGFGSVTGAACPFCIVDIYSDDEDEARVHEGSTVADEFGVWTFTGATHGPNVTATATDPDGNTSELSAPFQLPATPTPTPSPTPAPTPSPTPTPPSTPTPTPSPTPPLPRPTPSGATSTVTSSSQPQTPSRRYSSSLPCPPSSPKLAPPPAKKSRSPTPAPSQPSPQALSQRP